MDPIPLAGNEDLVMWTKILTGLNEGRVRDASRHIASWGIRHLNRELLAAPSVDHAVAAVRLSDAFQSLSAAGVPETKILAKLRRDYEVWPAWAELRAADLLLRISRSKISL